MTLYTHYLIDSWRKLLRDHQRGAFTPASEADVQCYLYHLLLEKIGDPTQVHAEWADEKGRHIDIMLGNKRLPIEIKRSRLRNWRKTRPSRRWRNDVLRLADQFTKRQPALAIFAYKMKNDDDRWYPIEAPNEQQRKRFEKLARFADKHDVKVYLPYLDDE